MNKIASHLKKLGLRQGEAEIYLCCLRQPRGLFVHEIVRATKIQRSTVDVMLDRLCQQGWLSAVREGGRFRFAATQIDMALGGFEVALRQLLLTLPQLATLPAGLNETEISRYEGVEGIKLCYYDMFRHLKNAAKAQRHIVNFSSGHRIMKIWPEIGPEWITPRIALGIPIYIISAHEDRNIPLWSTESAQLREVRYLKPDDRQLKVDFICYGSRVAILSAFKPISAIIIDNALIAAGMAQIFWSLWRSLPAEGDYSARIKRPRKT